MTKQIIPYLAVLAVMCSCSSPLDSDGALERLVALEEFQAPYYAPLRVGEMVLTGDNHTNSDKYIDKHYAPLIQAGLVQVDRSDRNSWRTVIDVQLTEQGRRLSDPRRKTARKEYVRVCKLVPSQIDSIENVPEQNSATCAYTFVEQDITPFGKYLGFAQDRTHKDRRTFVRTGGSWKVVLPITAKRQIEIEKPAMVEDTTQMINPDHE